MLDVFKKDAFNTVSLTKSINTLPYQPQMIGASGLFEQVSITTTTALIEKKGNTLSLVPTAARGARVNPISGTTRTARAFVVPHIPDEATVMADEVQDVRAFGSENNLETVNDKVNDKLTICKNNIEVTKEYYRISAIQGVVLDSDGATELFDWFTEFGITESEVDVDLSDSSTDVRAWINEVIRTIEDALGASVYTGIRCAVGNAAWDAFVRHAEVKADFARWQDGRFLREEGMPYRSFEYGGVTFFNYRGKVGSVNFVPTNVFRFYPTGIMGLFQEIYAPAPFIETVNTPGLPFYAKQQTMDFDVGIEIHAESNPLMVCTRPSVLVKSTATVSGSGGG